MIIPHFELQLQRALLIVWTVQTSIKCAYATMEPLLWLNHVRCNSAPEWDFRTRMTFSVPGAPALVLFMLDVMKLLCSDDVHVDIFLFGLGITFSNSSLKRITLSIMSRSRQSKQRTLKIHVKSHRQVQIDRNGAQEVFVGGTSLAMKKKKPAPLASTAVQRTSFNVVMWVWICILITEKRYIVNSNFLFAWSLQQSFGMTDHNHNKIWFDILLHLHVAKLTCRYMTNEEIHLILILLWAKTILRLSKILSSRVMSHRPIEINYFDCTTPIHYHYLWALSLLGDSNQGRDNW